MAGSPSFSQPARSLDLFPSRTTCSDPPDKDQIE